MSAPLEEILSRLLVADNAIIQQGTQQLKEAFKDPAIVPELCRILGSSSSPQIRQYSAVLLRRKLQKLKQWRGLPAEVSQNIRDNILVILLRETEKSVASAIAQIVATIAKHDLSENLWPGLFQFIQAHTSSPESQKREVGMFVLNSVGSVAGEQLKPYFMSLMALLTQALNETENKMVPFYAIQIMTEMVFLADDDEGKFFQQAIPRVLEVTRALVQQDEDQASEAMDFFDELLECEVAILVPHLKTVVGFCLEVSANAELSDPLRVKALSFISSVIANKKKAILKHGLVVPVLQVLFPVVCSGTDDDGIDGEDEDEAETHTPAAYATQVIDAMALHLPPEKLIPNVMKLVEPALVSAKPQERRAAFLTIGVTAEGCADYITNKHLDAVLQCVCKGVDDEDQQVRNAAMFALGQFSEHLQPDISKFASQLLPLLYTHVGRATQEVDKNPTGITKSYYALEAFCENLGKDILPYLPPLMEHLLCVLNSNATTHMKELAISAIGATASAAKEGMQPYFQQILEQLKMYLTDSKDEKMNKLQIQAIDTLGVLARTVGNDTFLPLAPECVQLGFNLLEAMDDPDLRKCVYGMFAAVSTLLKADFGQYLGRIVPKMLESIKSAEGIQAHYSEEKATIDNIFNEEEFVDDEDGEELKDETDEEEDDIQGISVENSYVDEKESACSALGELATNVKSHFMPYLEESYQEVLPMLDYPSADVRKGACTSLGAFCCCVFTVHQELQTQETQTALQTMVATVVPKLLEIIRVDDDRLVAITAVDTLREMVDTIKAGVVQDTASAERILTVVKEIFAHKTSCQDENEDDDSGLDDDDAEYDSMLVESAGDMLPCMAKVMGGEAFIPILANFIPDLLKKTKDGSAISEQSFAIGTLAETVFACGPASVVLVDTLYPVFVKGVLNKDSEVRSNSIYGLGVLVANGVEKLGLHMTEIVKQLFEMLKTEESSRVRDNICAATCRLVMTDSLSIPLDQVLPIIVQCLPLKDDYEENATVFGCFLRIMQNNNTLLLKHIPDILLAISQILGTDQVDDEAQPILIELVKTVSQNYPEEFQNIRASMVPEMSSKLDTCLTVH